MNAQMNSHVAPYPVRRAPAPVRQANFDGEYFEDELPPELFDEDEDREELALYVHMAQDAIADTRRE